MHLQIFSTTDARMTVKRVGGDTVGTALEEVDYEPGAPYDVIGPELQRYRAVCHAGVVPRRAVTLAREL